MQPAGQRSRLRKIAHAALYPVLQPRFARYSRRWSASCPWLWALDGARASISELPRRYDNDRQGAKAVAEPAVHARPTDHAMTSLWHRFCVTTGRPAASNDETEVHCVLLAQCGQLARSSALPRGSRVCVRARQNGPAWTPHTTGPCSSWAVRSRPTSLAAERFFWRRIIVKCEVDSNRRNGKAFVRAGQGIFSLSIMIVLK